MGQAKLEDAIAAYVGDYADHFNRDALAAAYRAAINAALPPGVTLNGNDFYGPAYTADHDFDGYPEADDGQLDIRAMIESIDFAELAQQHDHTAR